MLVRCAEKLWVDRAAERECVDGGDQTPVIVTPGIGSVVHIESIVGIGIPTATWIVAYCVPWGESEHSDNKPHPQERVCWHARSARVMHLQI